MSWRELGASWSELGARGVSWSKGSELEQAGRLESAGSKLGGWKELGASWERAGASRASWSELE